MARHPMGRFSPFRAANSALMLRSWRRGQSASSASKRCTTTCTISSGRGASSSTSSTSPRSGGSGPELEQRRAPALGRVPGRRRARSSSTSRSARAGAPGATCASTPTASARSCSRSRTSRRTFALLDERGGTFITDIQRFTDDGGDAGDVLDHHAVRRHHLPLRRAPRLPRAVPGLRRARRRRAAATNRFGFERIDHLTSNFQTMKPALLWMEHVLGFEQLWEIAFHTNDVAAAQQRRARLGPQVGRDVGSGLGREVRQQRAVPPVLQGVADQHLRRGQPRRRRPALGAGGDGHRRRGARRCARSGVEFMPTPGSYYDMLPGAAAARSAIGTIDEEHRRRCASSRSWSTASSRTQYLLQIFLKEAAGLLRRSARPGRSSSRSSSARATRASAPATSARCSRASSASSSSAREAPRDARCAMLIGAAGRSPPSTTRRCATPAGELRYEECLTRDGFDGPYTILYHARPAAHGSASATAGARLGDPGDGRRRARARSRAATTDRRSCRARGGAADRRARAAAVQRRRRHLGRSTPTSADPGLLRQRRRRRSVLHARGRRHAALGAGRRRVRARATTSSSRKGLRAPLRARRSRRSTGCRSSARPGSDCRGSGATRSASCAWTRPTATATSGGPRSRGPRDEGLRDLVVKRGGAFHGFRYAALAARRRRLGRHGLPVGVPDPATSSRASGWCTCRRRGTARSRRAAR